MQMCTYLSYLTTLPNFILILVKIIFDGNKLYHVENLFIVIGQI
jgi:hypothetical protein